MKSSLSSVLFILAAAPVAHAQTQAEAVPNPPAATSVPAQPQANSDAEVITLDSLSIVAERAVALNSIDRKVYNVGDDILSAAGSASDLLQNIPSVSVDIDSEVSLRGSSSVTILIDGRSSSPMGSNRGAVLEQMSADSILRIEVITNPSAKYKPDGTGGIINIVTKKTHQRGRYASVSANLGSSDRYNATTSFSINPGTYTFHGSYSIRQDDRERYNQYDRLRYGDDSQLLSRQTRIRDEQGRPLTHVLKLGYDRELGESSRIDLSASYDTRSYRRNEITRVAVEDPHGELLESYERERTNRNSEYEYEFDARYHRDLAGKGHELDIEFSFERESEGDDDNYANRFFHPASPATFERDIDSERKRSLEFAIDYVRPLGEFAQLEAGYTWETEREELDVQGELFDPVTQTWILDTTTTNQFIYDETLHSAYATYRQSFGDFGYLAGIRAEQADIVSHLVTTDSRNPNDFFRLYPSLHLTYALAAKHELQLNYSHRVDRPDGDDLNPFSQYSDPQNLRAGNPFLVPEDTHSIEFGHHYRTNSASIVSTAYYRKRENSITSISRLIENDVLLTTKENLGSGDSLGLEFAADGKLASWATANFSANTFFQTIDATNLGLGDHQSDVSWIAKLGFTLRPAENTIVQLNANYSSERLTTQGNRGSSYIVNLGLRQEILKGKAALTLTVSDLFDSLREVNVLNTPDFQETSIRRRSPRTMYLGISYKFGQPPKRSKDESLQFDESL